MKNTETAIKKENKFDTFADLAETTKMLSSDISKFLSDELDELNISSYLFRNGMDRCLGRMLTALIRNTHPVVIFPDSVPGFTMMVFKKPHFVNNRNETPAVKPKRNPVEELNQSQAIDSVVGKFFDKNKQKVLIIENKDIIFALFPVADTKKNLKDMDLYITF